MTRHRRFRVHNRLVHPIEWRSFADQLDTLRELKDFLTVDGVLQKVDLLGAKTCSGRIPHDLWSCCILERRQYTVQADRIRCIVLSVLLLLWMGSTARYHSVGACRPSPSLQYFFLQF